MAKGPSRLDNVISLAKRRGFVFPCGDIYGGTRSAWDYGPLGVELKENIKRAWWNAMVRRRADVVGLDSSVILPREVWVASGHVKAFTDPLIECLNCHKRAREDQLIEELAEKKGVEESSLTTADLACPTVACAASGPNPAHSPACSRPTWAPSMTRPACTTCAPRPLKASSSTTRTS